MTPPKVFKISIGDSPGLPYEVELQKDGTLQYTNKLWRGGEVHRGIEVTEDSWITFRNILDEIDVWSWKKEYSDIRILDGIQWELSIHYIDASVDSHGDNRYPPKQDFDRLLNAVTHLIGGLEFGFQ